MNETKRKKTEKQILRLAAEITYRKLKNVEIGLVTYTSCELSIDGSHADISVSVYDAENDNGKSINSLNRAAGFFRNLIGKSMGLRNAPEIRFVPDTSYEKMQKIDSLIDG
jgi:ribosome-binding factor A